MHTVVNELVGALATFNQVLVHRFPKSRVHPFLGPSQNVRECRDVGDAAEAGELPQRALRLEWQPRKPPGQELHDIVGMAFGADAIDVPGPMRVLVIESQ